MSLDVASSIIALIQATKAIIDYIDDVKDAKDDKRALLDELRQAEFALKMIQNLAKPDTGQTYLDATKSLISQGGLTLYKKSLDELFILSKKSRFKWPFEKKDVAVHVGRVERANSILTMVIQGDHVRLSSAIYEEVQRMRDAVDVIVGKTRTNEERGILDWIGRYTPETDHERVAKPRLPGTGQWFLQREEFVNWRNDPKPGGLWALGNPGVGKTILSSLVIDELFATEFEQKGVGVAYFYFDYTKRETHSASFLLRSVLRQLCSFRTPLPGAAVEFHKTYSNRPVFANRLAAYLSLVVQEFSRVYVVIDALDEFEEGPDRAELLEYLTTLAQNSVKLLVTSRPHPNDIKRRLNGFASLEVEANPDDIQMFLHETISKDGDAMEIMEEDEGLREDIVKTLMDRAQGMFLLPQLQIRGLLHQRSSRGMREALEALPNSLDLEFNRTWERIQKQQDEDVNIARHTLTWLCYARSSLSIDELRDALATRPNDTRLDSKGRTHPKFVVNSCFGLVIWDAVNDTFRFVHFSVQEYFHRYERERFPMGQSYITETCFTYLTFQEFSQPCTNRQALDDRLQKYPFLKYAACHWGYHCSLGDEELQTEGANLGEKAYEKIVDDPYVYESMLQALVSFDNSWGIDRDGAVRGQISAISKYHFAAAFGLISVILKLFETKEDDQPMERDLRGRFPVHYAAENGHEGVITLLLGMNLAPLAATDDDGRTPFALAAAAGHNGVTRLLLEEQGIKVDTKDRNGETPLFLAARGGHQSVVNMLLQRGSINLNSRQMFTGFTPIMEAALNGHVAVVHTLAHTPGVLVDARETMRRTALSMVTERNHVETAQTLLAVPGVDPNSEDMRGHTPLFHAAWSGAFDMVSYLLTLPSISINQKSHFGETALSVAARSGHDSCIRLLLADGRVEVNTLDYEGRSPLEHAVRMGHRNVVRLLVADQRVELGTRNAWGRSPMHYAVREGMGQVREMLQVEIEGRRGMPFRLVMGGLGDGGAGGGVGRVAAA